MRPVRFWLKEGISHKRDTWRAGGDWIRFKDDILLSALRTMRVSLYLGLLARPSHPKIEGGGAS